MRTVGDCCEILRTFREALFTNYKMNPDDVSVANFLTSVENPVCNDEAAVDPIEDIIDYLVTVENISVKSSVRKNSDKKVMLRDIFQTSIIDFLIRFGKNMTYSHLSYFTNLEVSKHEKTLIENQLKELQAYLSADSIKKRIKNRRYAAMLKLQEENEYFSEKEMMYRNPLLYEQLVGQYLTNDEIALRDKVDANDLTLSGMILDSMDKRYMRERKNQQLGVEKKENKEKNKPKPKLWGEFEGEAECNNSSSQCNWSESKEFLQEENRKEILIDANERSLLRKEFYQEMCNSFLEGCDDYDYESIDRDESLDNLEMVNTDMEAKYFDSEPVECENLEQSMLLAEEYGKKEKPPEGEDELDIFMKHLTKHAGCNNG